MKTLLVINSSGRVTRSLTRKLTHRFAAAWRARHPNGTVVPKSQDDRLKHSLASAEAAMDKLAEEDLFAGSGHLREPALTV